MGLVLPPLLGCALAVTTVTIVAAEIRRADYHVDSGTHSVETTSLRSTAIFAKLLRLFRWLVLFVIVPLLSIPVYQTHQLSETSTDWAFTSPKSPLVSFQSWDDAILDQESVAPALYEAQRPSGYHANHPLDRWANPLDTWRSDGSYRSTLVTMCDDWQACIFDHGAQDILNAGIRSKVEYTRTFMPMSPLPGRKPGNIPGSFKLRAKYLQSSLMCTIMPSDSLRNGTSQSIIEYDGCRAPLSLPSLPIDFQTRTSISESYDFAIGRLEEAIQTGGRVRGAEGKMRERLHELREDRAMLDQHETLYLLHPRWTRAEGGDGGTDCSGVLFYVGSNRPIHANRDLSLSSDKVTLAMCVSRFLTGWNDFEIGLRPHALLAETMIPETQAPGPLSGAAFELQHRGRNEDETSFLDVFTLWKEGLRGMEIVTTVDREPKDWPWYPSYVPTHLRMALQDAMAAQLVGTNAWYATWLKDLLELRHEESTTVDPNDQVAVIVLGAKMLSSHTIDFISNSMSRKLARLLTLKGNETISIPYSKTTMNHVYSSDIYNSTAVQIFLLLVAYIAHMLLQGASHFADDRVSGLPWSISSIGAKAILLVNSKLRSAFALTEQSPEELRAIPDIRLGRWAKDTAHSAYAWRLDTLCNRAFVDEKLLTDPIITTTKLWQRHNKTSVPLLFRWPSLTLGLPATLLFSVALVYMRTGLQWNDLSAVSLTRVILADYTLRPGFGSLLLFVLLPLLTASVFFALWDDIDRFYAARQPWASLATSSPARKSLTLDYLDSGHRIRRAVSNKHWRIVLLSIGSSLILAMPLLAANLARLSTETELIETISIPDSQSWKTDAHISSAEPIRIPTSGMSALLNPPTQIAWTVGETAILPAQVHALDRPASPPRTFWKMNTTWLQSSLTCEAMQTLEIGRSKPDETQGKEAVRPRHVVSALPNGTMLSDGRTTYTVAPCGTSLTNDPPPPNPVNTFMCASWEFSAIDSESHPQSLPVWFVTILSGEIVGWSSTNEPLIASDFSATTMMCEPRMVKGQGIAQLFADGDGVTSSELSKARVRHITRESEEPVDMSVSDHFSHLLNVSVHDPTMTVHGYVFPQDTIASWNFVGDNLGYLLYRVLELEQRSVHNLPVLKATISHVYATLFASIATETEFLKSSGNETINVKIDEMRWTESFKVRKVIMYPWMIVNAIILLGLTYFVFVPKKYIFPLDPEVLHASLFLLMQSSIVDSLASIPRPEEMTMDALHRAIEAIGDNYVFDRYKADDDHYEQFGIDTVQAFAANKAAVEEADAAARVPFQEEAGEDGPYRDSLEDVRARVTKVTQDRDEAIRMETLQGESSNTSRDLTLGDDELRASETDDRNEEGVEDLLDDSDDDTDASDDDDEDEHDRLLGRVVQL